MLDCNILEEIRRIAGTDNVATEEPMSRHTTFRIGGNAAAFVTPTDEQQIKDLVDLLNKSDIMYTVVGNGSNLLVSDNGYDGVIIQLGDNFSSVEVIYEDEVSVRLRVEAGMRLTRLGNDAAAKGWSGFEFATGIPGNLGGAVRMNAGAYGGEMKDVLEEVTVLLKDGSAKTIPVSAMKLGYRTSVVAVEDMIVLSAVIKLNKGNSATITEHVKELAAKRREKQPLEYPSAGSTFKRPEGFFAAQLIDEAGLKGTCVGGAEVSTKHAGFVINKNNATAADVIAVIDKVRSVIRDQYGVDLELEVVKLGF